MPNSRVVFDVAQGLSIVTLVGLALVILMGFLAFAPSAAFPRIFRFPARGQSLGFDRLWLVGLMVICFIAIVGILGQWVEVRSEYGRADLSVVQGCVTRFHPASGQRGDAQDMIQVAGTIFHYPDNPAAFAKTEIRGGPVRPGSWVRVTHVANDILRLEAIDHTCPQPVTDAGWRAFPRQ